MAFSGRDRPSITASRKLSSSAAWSWKANRVTSSGGRSSICGQPHAGEGPARGGREEVAVADAYVVVRRDGRAAAQHHLAGHELAVVLADRPLGRTVARVGHIGAHGPLPDIADHLLKACARRRPWVI